MTQDSIYIFGYGSLIWRPGFPYSRRFNAYVKGFKRRFWQQSRDHRGTDEHPGRVVTIVPTAEFDTLQPKKEPHDEDGDIVWGVVYQVEDKDVKKCLDDLDIREIGGYHRTGIPVYTEGDILACEATLYVGSVSSLINTEFIGPEDIDKTATIISRSVGPSGPNPEYLKRLADSLRSMSLHDTYIFELEKLVNKQNHNSLVQH
ncbi:glutathione-specific gamma-glutamylcyclotransferase [Acrasis kona]|uniref:glutathione-specific gamma-glutamylcyclotransferase n=1 Tax=Acrasis kona TaxID=1008807 RepID=A0AAW2YSL6_9EUKA